jgi:hypothetical protein
MSIKAKQDSLLKEYEQYTKTKARMVTYARVLLKIEDRDIKSYAELIKYPRSYAVLFSAKFYNKHKHNAYVIKNIISHELAHIVQPGEHDSGFRVVAWMLGCAEAYQGDR